MNIGWHDICIRTQNMSDTKAFYVALGFTVTHDSDSWVHLSNGDLNISLMTFLGENWLNFRGGDVAAIKQQMDQAGISTEGQSEAYEEADHRGTHWQTKDPEGNVVYFDTTEQESTKAMEVKVLLTNLEKRLEVMGIQSKHFGALKAELEALASKDN